MTVRVNKPAVNLREKLAELDLPNHGKLNVNDDGDLNVRGKVNGTGAATFGSVSADTLTATTTLSANSISTTGGDVSFTDGTGTTPKFFWDASAESLGIGTSSPSEKLELIHNGANRARVSMSDTGCNLQFWNDNTATFAAAIGTGNPTSTLSGTTGLKFDTYNGSSWSEAMRIDRSGNLLVGKTVADNVTQGIRLLGSAGFASFVRSGAEPIVVNRLTDDGDIIDFRKDSATVGSIGSAGGDLDIGTGDTAIRFNDGIDSIFPVASVGGVGRDNAVDLGFSGARFKDLYLSGGVYLGGTGAANKLDDYEEGTFVATLRGATTEPAALATTTARYTKVGRNVTFQIEFNGVSTVGYSGGVRVEGLPFSAVNSYRHTFTVSTYSMLTFEQTLTCVISAGSTTLDPISNRSNSSWSATTHNAGASRFLVITGTYLAA